MPDSITLEETIRIKRQEIGLARENIQNVQADLKGRKFQLHELELELATLERALAIVRGQRNYVGLPTFPDEPHFSFRRRAGHQDAGAVFLLAEQILRVIDRPLSAGELLPIVIDRRKQLGLSSVSRQGLAGVLHRLAKKQIMFHYHGSGKFGLIEWQQSVRSGRDVMEQPLKTTA